MDLIQQTRELKTIKADIDKIKADNARLEGRREQLLNDLKTKFGVNSVEEASVKLSEMKTEYELTNAEAMKIYQQIKSLYDGIKSK